MNESSPHAMRKKKKMKKSFCPDSKKRRFRSQCEAIAALHTLSIRSTREDIPVRAYACKRCNGWHLTKQNDL